MVAAAAAVSQTVTDRLSLASYDRVTRDAESSFLWDSDFHFVLKSDTDS